MPDSSPPSTSPSPALVEFIQSLPPEVHEKKSLEGENAIRLWKLGRDDWNKFFEDRMDWIVNFHGIDFSKHYQHSHDKKHINFVGYLFSCTEVYFSKVKFGDVPVLFDLACFNCRGISFNDSEFKGGRVSFRGVDFNCDHVFFKNVNFNTTAISFDCAIFRKGHVTFGFTVFKGRLVNFQYVVFGCDFLSFTDTNFVCEALSFQGAYFGGIRVAFSRANIEGLLNFHKAYFTGLKNKDLEQMIESGQHTIKEIVNGRSSRIYSVDKDYRQWIQDNQSLLNRESVELEFVHVDFCKTAVFMDIQGTENVKLFLFRYTRLERSMELSGKFKCVPDLRSTKLDHHLDIHNLKVKPQFTTRKKWKIFEYKIAKDKQDYARLQRLKELTEGNKDHEAAQEFYAQEMRAARWHLQGPAVSLLHILYDLISNYGRSIWRPFAGLGIVWLIAACCYLSSSLEQQKPLVVNPTYTEIMMAFENAEPYRISDIKKLNWVGYGNAALISATNILPFIPSARESRNRALDKLYNDKKNTPLSVDMMMFLQGGLSFLFLFLIGLALRNRFRL